MFVRTSVEKGLLLGPALLSEAELDDAAARGKHAAAADKRLQVETGGEHLAQLFWAEKARRDAVAKGDPGAGDVHVNKPLGTEKGERLGGKPGPKAADVDAKQLALGVREEMEHTNDPKIAEEIALDHLGEDPSYYTRAKKADRTDDPGVMIALRLPQATANTVAVAGGEAPERLHVTLAYLGRMSKLGPAGLMSAADAIGTVTSAPILRGVLSGVGRFAATETSDGKDVLVRLVDAPGLTDLRARLVAALDARGVSVSRAHDFTPHLTLAYVDPARHYSSRSELQDVYFDAVVLSVNDSDTAFPLGQPDPLAAARAAIAEPAVAEVTAVDGPNVTLSALDGEELVAMSDVSLEPGDRVAVTCDASGDLRVAKGASSTALTTYENVLKAAEADHDRARHETIVPFIGPDDAPVVFVTGAPNDLELARGEPLVGPDGAAFAEHYLAPLGLAKSEVAVGFACPVLPRVPSHELGAAQTAPWANYVEEQLARWPDAAVVAVGKAAAEALGDRALLWLPHPCAARLNEARYDQQIGRKVKRIRKALDDGFAVVETRGARAGQPEILAGRIGETLTAGPGRALARVAKAAREKQIVYGVVLDPYEVDTQTEWVPPAIVESTAHDYLRQSRVIGREHLRKARAELVESFCVHYPSAEDYQAAMSLQPHKAYVMPYGEDQVHSGAWIAGVRLGDAEWDAYKRGEITGFSIGGFSAKTTIDRGSMPSVTFVPLVEGK